MAETDQTSDVSALTVQLLSAYLANNTVPAEALAELIRTTKAALTQEHSSSAEVADAETFTPAVTARKSLASPEHIISLIDGKPYKTLKRHLASRGLTPDEYRARYDLPASYPMVATAYTEHRRAIAHRLGLGRKGANPEADEGHGDILPIEAIDTPLTPEPVPAEGTPAKPPKKAAAKRAPRAPRQATAGEPDSSADMAPATTTDDSTTESPIEIARKLSSASNPRDPKPSAAKRKATSKSKPSKQAAAEALESPRTDVAPDRAEDTEGASEARPNKRRGKIGLFNNTSSEAVTPADALDTRSAAGSAEPDAVSGVQEQSAAAPESKARGSKRMAR